MFYTRKELDEKIIDDFLSKREDFFTPEQYFGAQEYFNIHEYLKYLYIHHQVKEKNENPYK